MTTKEFVNPRVAAKHAKREENKRKAIEKAKREKENKVLRKALGDPQKLFDDLQEANNVIRRLTASVDEEAERSAVAASQRARAVERMQLLLDDKLALKEEVRKLTAERNAAKETLDWKERGEVFVPLAQAKVKISQLEESLKTVGEAGKRLSLERDDLAAKHNELAQKVLQLEAKHHELAQKVLQLEAERDGLKVDLADALGKPPRAPLVMHASAEQPVRIPPDRKGEAPQAEGALPDLQPGDEAEAG